MVQLDAVGFGLLHQNGHAHFQLRRLDFHRQAPGEARNQPLFHAFYLLGVGVAGHDDLLAALNQRVEGVEEFFLGAVLAGKKLDVVNQQQIQRVVVALEFVKGLVLVGAHDVGHIAFGVDVADFGLRVLLEHVVANGLNQVGLTQAHATVDKQRVVGLVARVLGNLHGRGTRQLVTLAGYQRVKGKRGVQPGAFVAAANGFHRGLLGRAGGVVAGGWRGCGLARTVADRSGHRQRLAAGRAQAQLDRGFAHQFYRQFFNASKEAILDELHDETVGCKQRNAFFVGFGRQRLDPGIELL